MFNIDVIGVVIFVLVFLPAVGIVDALVHSATSWRAAKRSRLAWVLLQLSLGVVGVALYLLVAHPSLVRQPPSRR